MTGFGVAVLVLVLQTMINDQDEDLAWKTNIKANPVLILQSLVTELK